MRRHKPPLVVRTLLLVAAMWCCVPIARADVIKSEAGLQDFTDAVMKEVGEGDLPGAYKILKAYAVLPGNEIDAGRDSSVAQRTKEFTQRYGNTVGYEFLAKRKVGSSVVRLTYLEKMQKHPLVWNFYCYQTPSGWVLSSFGWNDQLGQVFFLD